MSSNVRAGSCRSESMRPSDAVESRSYAVLVTSRAGSCRAVRLHEGCTGVFHPLWRETAPRHNPRKRLGLQTSWNAELGAEGSVGGENARLIATSSRRSRGTRRRRRGRMLRAGAVEDLRPRCGPCACLAVGPRARDRVQCVRDRKDPRALRDLLSNEPVGIALAVPPFVVEADQMCMPSPCRKPIPLSICSPRRVCVRISRSSAGVSGPGLRSTSSGIPILPTSCRRKPYSVLGSSSSRGATIRVSTLA